jgi:hypothetical protein
VLSFLTASVVTSNHKIVKGLNWRPQHESFMDGITTVVQNWQKEGLINKIKEKYPQ